MTISPARIALALFFFTVILLPAVALGEQTRDELNLAQRLVFLGEHLRGTHQGQTLIYDFTRRASGKPDHSDQVKMTVTGVVDAARRDLSFDFLSGEDRLDFPDARGYRGNPVAVQFLERDIRDMAERTGTPIAYFRNRIRRSFVDPRISQTRVHFGDRVVQATEIVVVPFARESNLPELDGLAEKEYLFVYSGQVAGDLIKIRTRTSGANGVSLQEELNLRHTFTAPGS